MVLEIGNAKPMLPASRLRSLAALEGALESRTYSLALDRDAQEWSCGDALAANASTVCESEVFVTILIELSFPNAKEKSDAICDMRLENGQRAL